MADQNGQVTTVKLLDLMQKTGCPIVQHNGQRKFGPPPDWTGSPPPKGCEVFIGKLPRDIYEDELVPLFATAGVIYEMRLMMDFSGSNRGYAFVKYATQSQAAAAVKQLNGYEIRSRRHIGVVKSVDNCRLFIGNIPKTKTREELLQELSKRVTELVDVIMYKNSFDRNLSRGFAFAEFTSHKAAAMARRELVPGCVKLWDQDVVVDWAEPEPQIDDEEMLKVKVLYVRNFAIWTTPEVIKNIFEKAIHNKIERVKKIYDYAFIHFYERAHAELAMSKLQNSEIDGCNLEIRWSKPVDRELYRIQKLCRGNAKFNKTYDLAQTLILYKQHLDKKEYATSPKDEGIGSVYAEDSPCMSPMDLKPAYYASVTPQSNYMIAPAKLESMCKRSPCISPMDLKPAYASVTPQSNYMIAPAKLESMCKRYIPQSNYMTAPARLESMCKRYMWLQPVYRSQKYVDPTGVELWVCSVDLPQVGLPLLTTQQRIGPLTSRACRSFQQAHVEAADLALQALKMLRADLIQQSVPAAPVYSQMPVVQNCMSFSFDYPPMYPHTPPIMPMSIPTIWRTV